MNKILLLLAIFTVGDCVTITKKFWWTGNEWTIIKIENGLYVIQDDEMIVHGVPESVLKKCVNT